MEKMDNLGAIIATAYSISDITDIPESVINWLNIIGKNASKRKGVYTVLVTLLFYKYLHPEQDVRRHQAQLPNGFSGRSFDTAHVTPVLKEHSLPSMAESGWLTRSLEQPYPYDMKYNGKIPQFLKDPFLNALDYVEKHSVAALNMLRILLAVVIEESQKSKIEITPLNNPDRVSIADVMLALEEHFLTKYGTHGGAKLPVLAFYAIYTSLIGEMRRYSDCHLADLSSITACDRTNKASGDIEIFRDNSLYETIEIKLDKKIDAQIVRVVQEKVYKWNPQRYYVLSVYGVQEEDQEEISEIVLDVATEHGCQIIINGLLPTIRYYLRLIENPGEFLKLYSKLVEQDTELQVVHKNKWNDLITKYNF